MEGWDLVFEVSENRVFVTWRKEGMFKLLTVSETPSTSLPPQDDMEDWNKLERLRMEATGINSNFTQHILKTTNGISPGF